MWKHEHPSWLKSCTTGESRVEHGFLVGMESLPGFTQVRTQMPGAGQALLLRGPFCLPPVATSPPGTLLSPSSHSLVTCHRVLLAPCRCYPFRTIVQGLSLILGASTCSSSQQDSVPSQRLRSGHSSESAESWPLDYHGQQQSPGLLVLLK